MTDPLPADIVYDLLAHITLRPKSDLRDPVRLVQDLKVDGDDYGMWLVPELQKRLGIRPSRRDWESVRTVGDLVTLVQDHYARRQASSAD